MGKTEYPAPLSTNFCVWIVCRALVKDNCAAGWMVLAGWDLNVVTMEEIEESEALEEETMLACQESLCSLESGVEEC